MATKTTRQHDPDHLQAEADRIERQYKAARKAAQQARATVTTARDNALTTYWQNRVTEFYDRVRPRVAQAWQEFEDAATGASEDDTLTAWRNFAQARAQAHGEHEVLRGQASRWGLRGVRPMLALQEGGYTECVARVLTRYEETQRQATAAEVHSQARAVGDAAEKRARYNGEVPKAPEIVARFKLGPSATGRDFGGYTMELRHPGDGRTVHFRDGLYYARDEETAQLIREHAPRKKIREIDEHGEEIDAFGDTFAPRP